VILNVPLILLVLISNVRTLAMAPAEETLNARCGIMDQCALVNPTMKGMHSQAVSDQTLDLDKQINCRDQI